MCKRELEGKRVLLTGGSSGNGWYLAYQACQSRCLFVVTSRRDERLKQLRLAVGNPLRRLIAVPGDVADPHHRQKVDRYSQRTIRRASICSSTMQALAL